MRSFNCLFLYLIATVWFFACNKREIPEQVPLLVVEGYIDDGGFPVVMLTTTLPVNTEPQSKDSIEGHLLKWAKVTVNDGEQEVVLTGMADKAYFPPFVYTTSRMRGMVGRSYTLQVDYENFHATAVTTIPERPIVDSLIVTRTDVDTLYSITAYLKSISQQKNYYMAFIRIGSQGQQWLPAYLGLRFNEFVTDEICIPIYRPKLFSDVEYVPFFNYGDSITVKIAQIDEQAYLFWKDYENSINFSRNPLFPFSENTCSNILGGIGCWYGSGIVKIPVIIH